MKNFLLVLFVGFTLVSHLSVSQDIHYSQFWMNNIQYNASLAGSMDGKLRANAAYRNQWQASSPFNTYMASVDTRIKASKNATLGVGGFFFNDVAGENRFVNNEGKLVVSSMLDIAKKQRISFGVGAGFIQKSIDWKNGAWNAQYQNGKYNANLSNQEENKFNTTASLKADLSLGASYFYGMSNDDQGNPNPFQLVLGFAVNHLLSPVSTFHVFNEDKLYKNIILHGEAKIQLSNPRLSLLPSYFMQFQGPSKEIVFGSQCRYALIDPEQTSGMKRLSFLNFGTHLRLNDAVITSVGLQLDKYTVGISYDWNINSSKRINQMNGAFEINLRYQMNKIGSSSELKEKE